MTGLFVLCVAAAVWLVIGPAAGNKRRLASAFARPNDGVNASIARGQLGRLFGSASAHSSSSVSTASLTILVQQMSALLRGGRSLSRLWEELWLVHSAAWKDSRTGSAAPYRGRRGGVRTHQPVLSSGSLEVLAAVRAASSLGRPVGEAIRSGAAHSLPGPGNREHRIWADLAACFDVAETSGCPLANILNRFASQLEAEEDADAARRTALAGPKATVRLLTWLPLLGLGLGMLLGVDPLGMLLASPGGIAALLAGLLLTFAGRLRSSRLVRAAADVSS